MLQKIRPVLIIFEVISATNIKIMGSRTSQHKNTHAADITWLRFRVWEFGSYLFTHLRNFRAHMNIIVFLSL